jgi:ribosomal protein S27AE
MGVKTKGGMFCERCGPVAAQKQTHKARAGLLFAATWGASMGAGSGQWHCPNCGGPVMPVWQAKKRGLMR